jgi:glycosyltransferase involved in cell wall biosynthesis
MRKTQEGPAARPHIDVCVCTFRRPRQLENLLTHLAAQETEGLFDYSIIIVDNDGLQSARPVVEGHPSRSRISMTYATEPRQNIALARNKAVEGSAGDFVAFIDDDEFPESRWLLDLYVALRQGKPSGVLGPVLPYFDSPPPQWVERGRVFERPVHSSGHILKWSDTRTGNVLLKRIVFDEDPVWFRPEYGSGGEDRDFFRRKIAGGHEFIWCNNAPVFETIPPERWKAGHLVKRALLRGKVAYSAHRSSLSIVAVSLAALSLYGLSLPYLLVASPVLGFEYFMRYLVKSGDHLGRILALLHVEIVKEKYISS